MSKTKIEWSDYSWNPLVGCSKISAGCSRCYAAQAAKSARLQQFPQYQKVSDWDGTIEFVENQLFKPLSWRSPKKVFVCSMSDIFHPNVKDEWLHKIFAVIVISSQHTFQILTKRPERMPDYFRSAEEPIRKHVEDLRRKFNLPQSEFIWPIPNLWVGVSVEDQKAVDERIPLLLQTPAIIRFISCEPLLEKIDLGMGKPCNYCGGTGKHCDICSYTGWEIEPFLLDEKFDEIEFLAPKLDWIIIGGESGPGARPCQLDWIRSMVRQCQSAEDVAIFVKQLGSNPIVSSPYIDGVATAYHKLKLKDKKGGTIDEFPEDVRLRQFPVPRLKLPSLSNPA